MITKEIIVEVSRDLEEIYPTFLENRKQDAIKIKTFIKENKIAEILTISHKIAGNAGSYELHDLGKIGAQMEAACIEKNLEKVKELFYEYQNYISKLKIIFK